MKKLITIFAIYLPSLVLFAQEDVTLIGDGDRKVEPAYRIALSPQIIDTVIPTPTVDYPLLSLKYETSTDVEPINPASIRTLDKLSQLYNTYVKLGVGSELMPLGEIYFDATRSRKFLYGAHLKHLSSFGNLPNYAPAQFDRTRFNLYGGINERKYSLRGDFHYNNQGLHYYGISDTLGLTRDSIAQRYQDWGLDFGFRSHKRDSAHINWNAGFGYNNFSSMKPDAPIDPNWRAKENYFEILSGVQYKHKSELYAAEFNIRSNSYKYGLAGDTLTSAIDTGIVMNNTVVNVKPTITTHLKDHRFKAKVGVDLVLNAHSVGTKMYIYPIAELKYSMFNDIFIPYVGLRGGLTQNTFKSLTRENEFLLENVNMLNEHKAIDFYGGIKGTLSKRMSFNIGASFANVKNIGLFTTDTLYSRGNQFNVIFDTANVATIEGSLSYQAKEKLKIDGIVRYNSYNLNSNSYAWNRPTLEVITRGSYNLFDKFLINLDVTLEGGRRALVYQLEEGVTIENGQFVKDLGFMADANLGVEYRYNKRISAFLQLNNIGAQRYLRYYNTPVQAFQVMGGLTFRF